MEELGRFLTDHEGKNIWLLIPPGFVSGTMSHAPLKEEEVFLLTDAAYYIGTKKAKVNQVTINMNQVYSWGVGSPPLVDEK